MIQLPSVSRWLLQRYVARAANTRGHKKATQPPTYTTIPVVAPTRTTPSPTSPQGGSRVGVVQVASGAYGSGSFPKSRAFCSHQGRLHHRTYACLSQSGANSVLTHSKSGRLHGENLPERRCLNIQRDSWRVGQDSQEEALTCGEVQLLLGRSWELLGSHGNYWEPLDVS